jgi:DNA-binding NarL/FixJ family response regulator
MAEECRNGKPRAFSTQTFLVVMSNHHRKRSASSLFLRQEFKSWGVMGSFSAATSSLISILVADSNHMHCQLLAGALRRRAEFQVKSCDLNINAILLAIAGGPTHVALIKSDGDWAVLRGFHLAQPQIAKVLLVEELDRDEVVNAFRFGAKGIVQFADSSFRLLCKCIQRVHQGQIWISQEELAYLIESLAVAPGMRVVNSRGVQLLTPREEQVVALVADGLSNRYIARELGLSEHTVKKYLFRIFDKLGVSTRVELVLYAMNHGEARPVECIPA